MATGAGGISGKGQMMDKARRRIYHARIDKLKIQIELEIELCRKARQDSRTEGEYCAAFMAVRAALRDHWHQFEELMCELFDYRW